MPLALFYEWFAYAMRVNPLAFGDEYKQRRLEMSFGMLAASQYNLMSGLFAKRGTKYRADDFALKFRSFDQPKKTPKQIYEALKMALILRGNLNANN